MFTGPEFVAVCEQLGISHVVWLPDSELGKWNDALEEAPNLTLVRVCREGEAWPLAAGLLMGGAKPLVVIQSTGFFEAGDSMRNVLFDFKLPIFALVGNRGYLEPNSADTTKKFIEPVLRAWGIEAVLLNRREDQHFFAEHYRACQAANKPGVVLMAEGKG